ncbi:MAG: thiolase family protein [Anaerolineae bacterium]|jgi:acetyl-CoA acetyltransferase
MFRNVYVPYKGYWSSPFCRWQGSLQNEHAVELAAATAKRFFGLRDITPDIFDGIVFGATVPQRMWFFDAPWFATLIGNPNIGGPRVAQACATSTVCVNYAATCIEVGNSATVLVATCDRTSNCPNILWPNPSGLGGKPDFESWMVDGFMFEPTGDTGPLGTANNVARERGITREESDALVLDRYMKYTMSTAEDRGFQKRYMLGVEVRLSEKKTALVEEDEGIIPCTAEGLAGLRPVVPDSIITVGAQTHAADGNAGMIVTTKEKADELSADEAVSVRILSYGFARARKAHMPEAPVPASRQALERAGITVSDLAAVKTHNPFSVNDIVMRTDMGIDDRMFNNYGSSLIYGHPQGPTTMRLAIELIEELVLRGGGYGLLAGCAAGDSGAALVIRVD